MATWSALPIELKSMVIFHYINNLVFRTERQKMKRISPDIPVKDWDSFIFKIKLDNPLRCKVAERGICTFGTAVPDMWSCIYKLCRDMVAELRRSRRDLVPALPLEDVTGTSGCDYLNALMDDQYAFEMIVHLDRLGNREFSEMMTLHLIEDIGCS